ncbi:uncharacterized protein LOC141902482 [Tubulanus polymorphus]|uniref:uncharacterized protein LOC141902482 n=1 Tax=Tubulanus polymorphus TaxID=672921 RepID=UPI003DA611FD
MHALLLVAMKASLCAVVFFGALFSTTDSRYSYCGCDNWPTVSSESSMMFEIHDRNGWNRWMLWLSEVHDFENATWVVNVSDPQRGYLVSSTVYDFKTGKASLIMPGILPSCVPIEIPTWEKDPNDWNPRQHPYRCNVADTATPNRQPIRDKDKFDLKLPNMPEMAQGWAWYNRSNCHPLRFYVDSKWNMVTMKIDRKMYGYETDAEKIPPVPDLYCTDEPALMNITHPFWLDSSVEELSMWYRTIMYYYQYALRFGK